MAGDLLDLQVALAPCVIGYAEIGAWLDADAGTLRDGNPYAEWIAMYAGAEYQAVAAAATDTLDALMDAARRRGPARFPGADLPRGDRARNRLLADGARSRLRRPADRTALPAPALPHYPRQSLKI